MARSPRKAKTVPSPPMIGESGLRQSGGFIMEEFSSELTGSKGAAKFRQMAWNDSTCGAMIFAITTLIKSCRYEFAAADDSPEAEDMKLFMEQVIDDMDGTFAAFIDEVCSMFTYGFAPFEIVLKNRGGLETKDRTQRSKFDDNRIGLRSLALRAQTTITRWTFDPDDGCVTGMWQQPLTGHEIEIPMDRIALFRTTAERNNPQGRSLLRTAWRSYYYKSKIEEIEAIGVERDLAGLPVARIPGNLMKSDATPADRASYARWSALVKNLKRDRQEGIVIPSDTDKNGKPMYDIALLSTAGSRQMRTTEIIDRYSRGMAMSMLADFIFLGQSAVGSFALSSDKTELFAVAVGAYTRDIVDTFNRVVTPLLWWANGFDPALMPALKASDIERASLTEIAALIDTMTKGGAAVFPNARLENRLMEMAGLPPLPEEGEDIDAPPVPIVGPNAVANQDAPADDTGADDTED